jgi:hypothetical protein
MAVTVKFPTLSERASTTNVVSFSVQEDATPIDPGSSAGGVGQIQFVMDDFNDARRLIGEIVLTDGSRGKTSGTIRDISSSDYKLSVTADSVLGLFNTDRVATPISGTLGAAVQYYADLVGIPNDVFTDSTLASRAVVYPGWTGNVWLHIKQMLAAEQAEMALVFDRVYVRPLRKLIANQEKMSATGWGLNSSNAAKTIEIYQYNNVHGVQQEVYPLPTEDPNIYTVDAGAKITFTVRLNASMTSINQPVVMNSVANSSYAGTNGVYAVSGNDGLPITAAQWTAQGGSLSVKIAEDDSSVLEVTVVGATMTEYAPYRIAMASGASNYYNSLHITGTGVVWDKKLVTLRTGASETTTSTLVGVTVDNPYISTATQAYSLGGKVAQAYAGVNFTVSGNAFDINRSGSGRELIQATIADFNAVYTPGTHIKRLQHGVVGSRHC